MAKKYLLFSLEDDSAGKLAGVLGNRTCKKIISALAEKELSEKDLSDELEIPINTVEYNLKKLVNAQIVEKTGNFFWSKKGKKIPMYKLSNKSIIISRSKKFSSDLRSILPVALVSGVGAIAVRQYYLIKQAALQKSWEVFDVANENALGEASRVSGETILTMQTSVWAWFLAGALFALLIYSIIKFLNLKNHNK